ncbi:hypothetical protein PILCRDRAFT_10666 [Piloderma croceum F 1598]|uniref:Peptidase A1 domain-containing protein n=1 Tax=Piloderma croceum (strain F 1598) TaxID=765440 RepID=A0A0C3BNU8_PILCF|nr:hypothetical protein PILCRDRAFT_10666 [Piloderma croceum F 1598]
MIHMGTLLLSFVAYLITLGVIGYNPASSNDIGKIFLWFAPMVFEIGSYFYIINGVKDHVKIKSKSVHKRSATLFVVILGEGLNQITGSFKYVVGAVGFTAKGVGIMFGAAVIIMGELALYSQNNWKTWKGGNRVLLWFFSHYVLMVTLISLILTLQCIWTLLSFVNLHTSITTLLAMADNIARRASSGNASSVTADMFPDAENTFVALGLPFTDFINVVNAGLSDFIGELTKNIQPGSGDMAAGTKLAQTFIYVACVAFNEFDAFPEEGSALYNEVQTFLGASYIYPLTVFTMLGDLLALRLHSAFWFWGTAGATLMMLAILSLLKQKPTDKYEFTSIMLRFWFGFIFLTLSGLIAGHNRPYFANADTATTNLHTSRPWKAAGRAWVIPSFAIVLVIVNLIDNYLRGCLAHGLVAITTVIHIPQGAPFRDPQLRWDVGTDNKICCFAFCIGGKVGAILDDSTIPDPVAPDPINNIPPVYGAVSTAIQPLKDKMSGTLDILYHGPIEIGTPLQMLTVNIDTGSADIWVPVNCPNCDNCVFNVESSSTYMDSGAKFKITYACITYLLTNISNDTYLLTQAVGQVSSTIATDIVSIGNLTVSAQSFGAVLCKSDDFNDAPNDGLIGLPFGTIAQSKKPTFFENLIEAKKVAMPLFNVHLIRNQVSWLGGLRAKIQVYLRFGVDTKTLPALLVPCRPGIRKCGGDPM